MKTLAILVCPLATLAPDAVTTIALRQSPAVAVASPGARETALMDRIEAAIVLPPPHKVSGYSRSYAWSKGGSKVVAVYDGGENERKWVREDELPLIADGGCYVINVVYDVRTAKIESVRCNGYA